MVWLHALPVACRLRVVCQVGGEGATSTDLIILTHETREGTMNDVMAQMQALPSVLTPITRIRKEELN